MGANCLDLTWEGKTYHGNYRTCRSIVAVKKYCTKVGALSATLSTNNVRWDSMLDIKSHHSTSLVEMDTPKATCVLGVRELSQSRSRKRSIGSDWDLVDQLAMHTQQLDNYIHSYLV